MLAHSVIKKNQVFNSEKFEVQFTPKSDQMMSYRVYKPCNNLNVIGRVVLELSR